MIIYWCQVKLSKIQELVHFFKFYDFYSVIEAVCIRILVNRLCEIEQCWSLGWFFKLSFGKDTEEKSVSEAT